MNIVLLRIKNFLSITDAEIRPGHINQIVGPNNAGKTTILRAIETALKGSSDGTLVKHGETQAEIIIEYSDGLNVRRRINADGTQNVRVSKDDLESKAPQGLLNGLFESSAFNPLELLEPKRRAEVLLQAVPARLTQAQVETALAPLPIPLPGIDYSLHGLSAVTQLHGYFYQRRTEANKVAKDEEQRLRFEEEKVGKEEPPAGAEEDAHLDRKTGECDAQLREFQKRRGEHNLKVAEANKYEQSIARSERAIRDLEEQLLDEKHILAGDQKHLQELQERIAAHTGDDEMVALLTGNKQLYAEEKLKNANHRSWIALKHNVEGQQSRAIKAKEFASELDRCVHAIVGKLKTEMMAGVAMPLPGIEFKDDKFLFEGCAVENLSTSASMKLACGLARSLAKKTKVICLDGAEALDEQNYALLKQEIAEDGFTYFLTKVGEAFQAAGDDRIVKMQAGQVVA